MIIDDETFDRWKRELDAMNSDPHFLDLMRKLNEKLRASGDYGGGKNASPSSNLSQAADFPIDSLAGPLGLFPKLSEGERDRSLIGSSGFILSMAGQFDFRALILLFFDSLKLRVDLGFHGFYDIRLTPAKEFFDGKGIHNVFQQIQITLASSSEVVLEVSFTEELNGDRLIISAGDLQSMTLDWKSSGEFKVSFFIRKILEVLKNGI